MPLIFIFTRLEIPRFSCNFAFKFLFKEQMKTASRTILFIALFLFPYFIQAQTYKIEGGYVQQLQSGKQTSATYFDGFQAGVVTSFDIREYFTGEIGTLYSYLYSNKLQLYPHEDSVTYTTSIHSINIPVHVTFTYPFIKKVNFFLYAGPTFNIGLSQPQTIVAKLTDNLSLMTKIPQGTTHKELYKDNMLHRFNLQFGAGGGFQWKKYQLKSGYDFGLINLKKSSPGSLYQKGWFVTLLYQF